MEKVYDLSKHIYCAIIFINNDTADISLVNILSETNPYSINDLRERASITYNKQRTKVLNWGNTSIENIPSEDDMQINNFMDGLYQVFIKDKKNECLTKAVSDFLSLAIKELIEGGEIENISLDSLFYTFVVPSEWEEEIREDLIRPIFIGANLISKEDHKDRLLFVSDIESLCYYEKSSFKRNQNTVMCRLTPVNSYTVLVKLDLIETVNALTDIPKSALFPKVICSKSFFITSNDIKNCINAFLKDKIFYEGKGSNQEIIKEEIYNIMNFPLDGSESQFYKHYDDTLKEPIFTDTTKWKLNDSHRTLLESICPFDIYDIAGKTLFNNLRDILSNQLIKTYKLIIFHDQYSSSELYSDAYLTIWVFSILEYNRQLLNKITTMDIANYLVADADRIMPGARRLAQATIANSYIHCPARIMLTENEKISSSVFINSKPDSIINIDVSLNSTLLSYSLLSEGGLIKEMFGHDYFTDDKHLPSLKQFYNVSNKVTLNVQEQFILFADNYLLGDINAFFMNEEFLLKIEKILYKDRSAKEKLICSYEQKYIKAFLLMYFIFIKEVISTKLSKKSSFMKMKIGYAISIEKVMLDSIFRSKKDLEELIYKSGLIQKDDKYKKLRIITPGEGVLSIIRQSFDLQFPVKSYFVLAQLHEDYIHLTLNQVVTASKFEDKLQEAIIVEDEVISIQNIYDSLFLNMWNNLIQNGSLIKLCNLHNRSNDDDRRFALFSLQTKKEFMDNFKKYISENILAADADLQNLNKNNIELNRSCGCQVYLTINDFVEALLKPLLKDINCILLTSLIDEELFGVYTSIKYHFSLIHFNHNPQLQDIIRIIMKEEAIYFNPKRGIDTLCMVIPKLPNQFFQSLLPFLYKGFRKGILYQVYDKDYAIKIYGPNEDEKSVDIFLLSKREDKVGCSESNNRFYVNRLEEFYIDFVMDVNEYEISNFRNRKSISKQKINWESIQILQKNIESSEGTAFIITIKSRGYLSLLQFSARKVGEHLRYGDVMLIGNPMTLRRF